MLFVLTLLSCLALGPSFDYELGYEEGCYRGQADAGQCADPAPPLDLQSEYASGIDDGYEDCYEAWALCE